MAARPFFIIPLLLLSLVHLLSALEQPLESVTSQSYAQILDQFGFEAGGTLTIKASAASAAEGSIYLLLCTDQYYQQVINDGTQTSVALCNPKACPFSSTVANVTNTTVFTVTQSGFYDLIIISCVDSEDDVSLSYSLLNPGGNQLSYGDIPLPYVYSAFMGTWGALLLTYFFTTFLIWRKNYTRLHIVLLAVIGMKTLNCMLNLLYWQICASSGMCLSAISDTEEFIFSVSECLFFCFLLLLAQGWKITRPRIYPTEIRALGLILVILLGALLFSTYYYDTYYVLTLLILYFFMLPKIFSSIGHQNRVIQTQLAVASRRALALSHTQPPQPALLQQSQRLISSLQRKFSLLRRARWCVLIYLATGLVVFALKYLISWNYDWISDFFEELNVSVMCFALCILLVPRNSNVFVGRRGGDDPANVENGEEEEGPVTVEDLINAHMNFMAWQQQRRAPETEEEPAPSLPYDVTEDVLVIEFPFNSSGFTPVELSAPSLRPLALAIREPDKKALNDAEKVPIVDDAAEPGNNPRKPATNTATTSASSSLSRSGASLSSNSLRSPSSSSSLPTRTTSRPSRSPRTPADNSSESDSSDSDEDFRSAASSRSRRSPRRASSSVRSSSRVSRSSSRRIEMTERNLSRSSSSSTASTGSRGRS